MNVYIALLAVIVVCLGGIALIVVRKFPQLAIINTEAMPKEQNLARKREIMDERVRRAAQRWGTGILGFLAPRAVSVRDAFRRWFKRLLTIDRMFRNEKPLAPEKAESRAGRLRREAAQLMEDEKFGEAEKKLIEVLGFDEMNEAVYRDLGQLYVDHKRWDRAKDTYAFLVKLLVKRHCDRPVSDAKGVPTPRFEAFADDCPATREQHADIAKQFSNFALACSQAENYASARAGLEHAVSFEPGNPRHLDSLVEACIMEGDWERAGKAWGKLRAANPENRKLQSLKERIDRLEEEDREEESSEA